jgi:4-amino-4-deoxy-L-arabinose transferase-like glycosyltransferase
VIQLLLIGVAFSFALFHPWSHALVGEAQFGDAAHWDLAGESWARGYFAAKIPDIRPGYSLFLGIVYSLSGVDFRHAFIAQALLFSLAALMVYRIGKRLGGRAVGLLAGLMLGLNPYMAEWVAISTTDLLGSVCNLAALYFLLRAMWRPHRMTDTALFGIFLGYANAVRPLTVLFVIPAMLITLIFAKPSWRKRAALSVGMSGALAFTLAFALMYQYSGTGEIGLSSNAAASFYGASSPKYRTWTNEVYVEVADQLRARGVEANAANMNAEFWRLTARNYLHYPLFQLQRIGRGFMKYAVFEGGLDRPDRYTFFRPYLVFGGLLAVAVPLCRRQRAHWSWLAMIVVTVTALMPVTTGRLVGRIADVRAWGWPGHWPTAAALPVAALTVARGVGVFTGARMLRRQPHPREVACALLASYWIFIGLSQALVGGTEGFLLHRLYIQAESVNTILIALGAFQLLQVGLPKSMATVRVLDFGTLARRLGRLPAPLRKVGPILGATAGLSLILGMVLMVIASVAPTRPEPFTAPDVAELRLLRERLGLPRPIQYVGGSKEFDDVLPVLTRTSLPERIDAYAVPGQFSRFLWYVTDQDRTEFWFFFANRPRPDSLDRRRLWVEAAGRLELASFRDRYGLLVLTPANAYFISSGHWVLLNLITARAFVPWDPQRNRFAVESAVVFSLPTLLVDPMRVAAADVKGHAELGGPVMVNPGGPNLRTLRLQPSLRVDGGPYKESAMTFSGVEILPKAQFKSFVSLHPRLFGLSESPPVTLQLWIRPGGRDRLAAQRVLKAKTEAGERMYLPFAADLGPYAGQRVTLTLRVVGSAATPQNDEVLIGEPRIVIP